MPKAVEIKEPTFFELIEQQETKDAFKEMLGERGGISFLSQASQVIRKDIGLMRAESKSVLNAVSAIASLNLMIDPSFGQAFMSVYKVKEGFRWKELAQFQIGYKGLIELGHRTGQFRTINPSDVREGEFVKQDRMTGEIEFNWNQDQDGRKKLPVVGFVAYFELVNGFRKSLYMTMEEMKAHGMKWSSAFKDKEGGWQKDFEGMGKKTTLKLLLDKYAPKSPEMQRAIAFDQAVINDLGGNSLNYVDNPSNKPKVDKEEHNRQVEKQRILDHIKRAKSISGLEQCFEHIPDDETRNLYDEKLKQLVTKKPKTKKNEQ